MKNPPSPMKRVVFDPKEAPVWFWYISPVNLAFTHAVLAGVMARNAQNESDTQNFEYLGDHPNKVYKNKEIVFEFIHHFRHIVTRKHISVKAPPDHISQRIVIRHWQDIYEEKMRGQALVAEAA